MYKADFTPYNDHKEDSMGGCASILFFGLCFSLMISGFIWATFFDERDHSHQSFDSES
jgi:hypothetical protein